MILRKPYAFLIRHFKLIHIIMFLLLGYTVFPLRKIYFFLKDYVQSGTFVYVQDMASIYVTPFMIICLLFILFSAIMIYFLMHKKGKQVLFYLVLIFYLVILLSVLAYAYYFFTKIGVKGYEPIYVVIFRDVVAVLYYINFFYVGFSFIRGFGFDIKKFSFEKDIRELNLVDSDNEEYEVNLNFDRNDIQKYVNKQKREMGYYIRENAFVLSILGIIILLIIGLSIYFYFFVSNKVYHENDKLKINEITYQVKKSYMTSKDKNNDVIMNNSSFVVVDLMLENNGETTDLKENFRLRVGDKYYYPDYNYYDYFSDLGNSYNKQNIRKNSSYNFLLIFKTEKITNKIYFEILKNAHNLQYASVQLNPLGESNYQEINYQATDEIQINNNLIKIKDYQIENRANFKYEDCFNEKCNIYTKTVVPENGEVLFILNLIEEQKNGDTFYEDYVGLQYDKKVISSKRISLITRNNNTLYFSVPREILSKGQLYLLIQKRDVSYRIELGDVK